MPLGILSLNPQGASEPVEAAALQIQKVWPPQDDSLIEIPAGGTEHQEVEIKAPVVDLEKLKGKAKMQLKGRWQAVWVEKKEDVIMRLW